MLIVDIDGYSKKGFGKGLLDSERRVQVVGAASGDRVAIRPIKKKSRREWLCAIEEIVSPSVGRVEPKCKHAGRCGGCIWQQVGYGEQLKEKEKSIQTLFSSLSPQRIFPIIPCEEPWNYRNKMEFSFSQTKEGERYLGLILAGSRGWVFNVEQCPISSPLFVSLLSAAREWWDEEGLSAYNPRNDEGALRTLTLREGKRSGQYMAILTVSGNPFYALRKSSLENLKKKLSEAAGKKVLSLFLRIQQAVKGHPTQFFEMHLSGPETIEEELRFKTGSLHLDISPSSFFQPNTLMAEKLYARAIELYGPDREETILDLYCGMGTIGMCMAPFVKRVIGVEINPYAVFDGQSNLKKNAIANMEILRADAAEFLKNPPTIDGVIVDPPRAGLGNAVGSLLKLSPKKILYISCNPWTQAEDIKKFLETGYELRSVQPVDQFPHTPHVETIAILESVFKLK